MDCREFERLVREHQQGRLSEEAWAAAQAHRRSCAACRTRTQSFEPPGQSATEVEQFVQGVMARTSGPACESAVARLDDFVDGTLPDDDAQLVGGHLEHCAPCQQLATCMAELRQPLREMATIDPGPAFTAAVLGATTGTVTMPAPVRLAGDRALAAATTASAGILRRLSDAWHSFVDSPRFTVEAAYICTLILVLLCGTPISPFRGAPQQAMALAEINPARSAVTMAGDLARQQGPALWSPLATRVSQSTLLEWPRQQVGVAATRWRGSRAVIVNLKQHGAGLGRALWQGDETAAGQQLELLAADLVQLRDAVAPRETTGETGSDQTGDTRTDTDQTETGTPPASETTPTPAPSKSIEGEEI